MSILIDDKTHIIVQGFTGKFGSFHAKEMIKYGTNIVGGGATPEKMVKAFKLISQDEKVKVILVNIFAGINRCDWVAEGIVQALKKIAIDMPLIIRLAGTNVEKGNKILKESKIKDIEASTLEDAANKAVVAFNKLKN